MAWNIGMRFAEMARLYSVIISTDAQPNMPAPALAPVLSRKALLSDAG